MSKKTKGKKKSTVKRKKRRQRRKRKENAVKLGFITPAALQK